MNNDDDITYALIEDDEEELILENEELIVEDAHVDIHPGPEMLDDVVIAISDYVEPKEDGSLPRAKLDEDQNYIDPHQEEASEGNEDNVVGSFVEKRLAQFRTIKLNRRKVKLYAFFSVAIVLTLLILLFESPIFSIDKVNVVQEKNVTPLSDAELAQVKKDIASVKNQQMYRSNFGSSNSKLKKLPYVKSVHFEKSWPSTVNVEVVHRVPIATIKTDKGYVLIDDESYIFQKTDALQSGLPVFKGFDQITFTEKLNDKNYISILNQSPDEIKNQIASVTKKDSKYFVTLSDGIVIMLGDTDLLKEKLAIAWSIILTKNRSQLGYIDVSVPSLPVSGIPKPEV